MSNNQQAKPAFVSRQVSEARLFFLNLKPPPGREMTVVCGGREHCRRDYRIERRDFPYYCLEFVSSGEGVLELGGRPPVAIGAGALFSYGPGIPHRIVAVPENPPVKYFVDVAGQECADRLTSLGLAPGTPRQATMPQLILRVFDDLIRHGQDPSPGRELGCRAVFEHLLAEAARNTTSHKLVQSQAWNHYQRCLDTMREQFLSLASLSETAEACYTEKTYLCRLFKRFSESSPYEFLMQLKMEYAAEQLRQSGALVREVAAELGFANPYHFSRVFKRIHGLAPVHFRRLSHRV